MKRWHRAWLVRWQSHASNTGTIGGKTLGVTAPRAALNSYNDARSPKALVNVKGGPHWSSVYLKGEEREAVYTVLYCTTLYFTILILCYAV